MFSGFYRDGDKVRAKNFQFLEAFKSAEPKAHATLLEMAKSFADKLGISPVMRHVKAWVTGDGEIPFDGKSVPSGALNSMPSMRLRDLLSCDFVQRPAANVALFSAQVDQKPTNTETIMTAETILLTKHTEEITSLSTQHKDAIAALEAKHKDAVTALEAKHNEAVAQLAKETERAAGLVTALAAKTQEAEEAAKYDMRKAGGEALQVALSARGPKLPEPAATDMGRWEQYAALCEVVADEKGVVLAHKDTPASIAFKTKFIDRK